MGTVITAIADHVVRPESEASWLAFPDLEFPFLLGVSWKKHTRKLRSGDRFVFSNMKVVLDTE